GYSGHSPTNDLRVITPTAALSSSPSTPEQCSPALHHFYYQLGGRIWGNYGFYDAFSPTGNWHPQRYLAIDQGRIVLMIENSRAGLLWEFVMACADVTQALDKLAFSRWYQCKLKHWVGKVFQSRDWPRAVEESAFARAPALHNLPV